MRKFQLQQENVGMNKKLIEILKIWLEMVSNLVIFLLYASVNTINWIEHYVYKMQMKLTLLERVVLVLFLLFTIKFTCFSNVFTIADKIKIK